MENIYNVSFYQNQMNGSLQSSKVVVPIVMDLIKPRSVIDIGCGVGTWLSTFKKFGTEIMGIDGAYINKDIILIENGEFATGNLEMPIGLKRTFDLAMSLEVAEHLSQERAESFVKDLTELSSVVLFSAAIPGQAGTNHINLQWMSYWINLFEQCGYLAIDCIRPKIWDNTKVETWYRQNTVLFCDKDKIENFPKLYKHYEQQNDHCWDIVHPQMLPIIFMPKKKSFLCRFFNKMK